jgi:hypothetical protein
VETGKWSVERGAHGIGGSGTLVALFLCACFLLPKASLALEVTVCQLQSHPSHFAGRMITIRGEFHDYPPEHESLSTGGCELFLDIKTPDPRYIRVPFKLEQDQQFEKWSSLIAPPPHAFVSTNRVMATYYGRFDYFPNKKKWEPGVSIRRLVIRRVSDVQLIGTGPPA